MQGFSNVRLPLLGAGVVLALMLPAQAQTVITVNQSAGTQVLPARPSFAGIGQVRARTDLLSNPARRMVVQTPAPTFTISPPNCQPTPMPGPYPQPYPQPCSTPTLYPSYYTYGAGLYLNQYNDSRYQRGFQEGTQTAQQAYAAQALMQAQAAQAAAAAPAQPVEPPTTLEVAMMLMRAERFEEAVVEFRKHVREQPDDTASLRLLAVAQIALKQCEDASAMMRMAYRTQPDLAAQPIKRAELGLTNRELRELVTKSVSFAHRVDSASSWLTVAALMQAEGRETLAVTMLARAEKSGLEPEVAAPLKAEMQ